MIQKRRTTDIHKISVVRLIIYSYSECLFLKVKLTSPPRNANRYKTSHLRERAANVLQIWK